MKMEKWLALVLCLFIPFGALAVTENVVEEAPMVEVQADVAQEEVSYLPDASYYDGALYEPEWGSADTWVANEYSEDGYCEDVSQDPYLTSGETRRAQRLVEDYLAGRAVYTGESVLNKQTDVIVGVYALPVMDFDGEAAYVLLPGSCLTDEQLLSIIAAYDELGLTFDPTALNYRNCSRGGGIETTRFLTAEERERYNYMAECVRRGQLVPPERSDAQNRTMYTVQLQERYYCGLPDFTIRPYRRMTDEELIDALVSMGVHDERGEIDHAAVEASAREKLCELLLCPISMKLDYIYTEGQYTPKVFTDRGEKSYLYDEPRTSFGVIFTYDLPNGVMVYASALYDAETKELVTLDTMHTNPRAGEHTTTVVPEVPQEKIDVTIAEVEAKLNLSGLVWHTMRENKIYTNWGSCIPVRAVLSDRTLLTVYIGCDDGLEHGIEIDYGTLVEELPPEAMSDNY